MLSQKNTWWLSQQLWNCDVITDDCLITSFCFRSKWLRSNTHAQLRISLSVKQTMVFIERFFRNALCLPTTSLDFAFNLKKKQFLRSDWNKPDSFDAFRSFCLSFSNRTLCRQRFAITAKSLRSCVARDESRGVGWGVRMFPPAIFINIFDAYLQFFHNFESLW